ncbi:ArsR/SmtB family transcription factor [Micromonospora sp. DT81.3]|uniref:ArsR/SmtB family transcription factor n=1 Tax=Micromonospora sp. DT81.3 TaxID=3416523 RepID=UPI003CF190B9
MHPFEVMAEPIRRRIVEILAVGEHPSSIIVDVIRFEFSVTSAAVSHHLRVLHNTGWVDVRHEETRRLHVLAEDGILSLHRDVKRLASSGRTGSAGTSPATRRRRG